MSLEGEEDDDKNADTFGDDAGGGEGGFGDLSDLAKTTAQHDAFLLENNARAGQRVGAPADDDAFNADWAGTGDDLTSLHKQFMAEYQTRALSDEGQSAAGRGHGHGGAAAGAAGAGAAGGEDDADLSIKSVLRAIDDEDAVAPASHAQRVARQPLPSAVPLLPSTPLKAGGGAGGAAAGVPATPPNPWAFSKPAGSPFVESFMSFSASPFKAAGAPAGAASAAQEAFNKGLAPPTPQRQAPQQPPQQQPQRPLLPPQQQPPQMQPQHMPPQPSPAKKGAVMNVADFEASLRGGAGNHSAGSAPQQPHGNGGLPPALAHFMTKGPGAGPQHPPPGMTSGQSFLAALNSGALQQPPQQPQRPGHIQLPPQHQHQPHPHAPHPAMRGPGPQPQFGPGPMPMPMPGLPPGGMLPADPAIAGAMSPASPLTGAMQPPPGTTAAEGNWYIPLPQRFSHTQMSKQEIAYVIRMQLKQLLPRPTLFLPASGTGADTDSTTDRSSAGGGGGSHTPASPSLTPSKAHGDSAPGAVMAPPVLPDDLAQDDFYAQVFMARKGQGGVIGGAGPSGAGSHALPASPYRNPDGSPKLPEGTLGRIAASSLRKPKKLMSLTGGSALAASPVAGEGKGEPAAAAAADKQKEEVAAAAAEAESGPARQFMFGRMSLTYLVEEAIRCLMNVEDVDSVLAAFGGPQPQRFEDPRRTYERRRLLAQRETLSLRLAEALDISDPSVPMDADHLILKFATVPKGRLLIFRSLLLLPPPQNFQIVNILMHNLSALAFPESKAAVDAKLSHVLCDALYAMPLAQLNQAFHLFISPRNAANMSALLRTKLGCMCAQVLMKRGNNLSVQLQHAQQAMAAHMQAAAQAAAQAHAHAQAAAAAAGQPAPPLPPQPRVNPALAAQLAQMQAAHAQWRQLFDYFGANVLPGKLAPLFAAPLKREAKAAEAKADAKAAPGAAAGERGVMQMPVAVPVQAGGAAKEDAKELAAAAAAAAVEYTSIGGLWELIAAVMSHVRKEQRNAFVAEFKALLSDEIDYITQKIAETRPNQSQANATANANANAQVPAPQPTLQLPPALLYLQSVATATAATAAGPAPASAPAQTQAASGPFPAAAAAPASK